MIEVIGEINPFFSFQSLNSYMIHNYFILVKKDKDILKKPCDMTSHGILKAYYSTADFKFSGLTPGRENYGFLHLSMNPAAGKAVLC